MENAQLHEMSADSLVLVVGQGKVTDVGGRGVSSVLLIAGAEPTRAEKSGTTKQIRGDLARQL